MSGERTVEGTVALGFEPVREAFEELFETGEEEGAATAAYAGGELVVDLRGGTADAERAWAPDTLVHTYSTVKPLVAFCALVLVDRGVLDLDAPVAATWPEFAAHGKGSLSLRGLLCHQAGLVALDEDQPGEAMLDWERMTALLAAEPPAWEPGTRQGEHAAFYGHLVGEVVRRADGRSPGRFWREEVAAPWRLDFQIGLTPDEIARTATLLDPDGAWKADVLANGEAYRAALDNPPGALDVDVVNSDAWRAAEIPAVNGHGTAVALARFYEGLLGGGELDGVRLVRSETVTEMVRPQADGPDVLLGRDVVWALGPQIDEGGFGHGGIGGSIAWTTPSEGYAFAYVTRKLGTHDRALAVEDALRGVLASG